MPTSTPVSETPQLLVEPEKLRQTIEQQRDLAILPAIATEAIEMANDPNCEIRTFVQLIERDAGLVTDLLSLSNSAAYQSRCEIKDIGHAVAFVGFRECKNLIISASMSSLMKKLPPSVAWSRDILWGHSMQTAAIARLLNQRWKLRFEGEEFSSAMLHDVGRMLIALAAPDVFEAVDRLSFCEELDFLRFEQELIGTDHCEIGAWFGQRGGLPATLVDAIRHHHEPGNADNSRLAGLIAAADHIANFLMFAGTVEGYDAENNVGIQFISDEDSEVKMSPELLQEIESIAENATKTLH